MFPHADWDALGPINPRPQLINDFTAYNTEAQLFPAQSDAAASGGLGFARRTQSAASTGLAT